MLKKAAAVLSGLAASVYVGVANAAITQATHLDPIGTEVSGDAATVFGWALPIIGTVLAMSVGIKLFKRFTNKV